MGKTRIFAASLLVFLSLISFAQEENFQERSRLRSD
jgi:hypothetical protein